MPHVVISNGDHGGFRHPRQVTLDSLGALPSQPAVFQTNLLTKTESNGQVIGGNTDPTRIADMQPSGPEGTIRVRVDGNAGEFHVRVGPGGTETTFPIKDRGPAAARVVIESLLPDPVGVDSQLEEITVEVTKTDGSSKRFERVPFPVVYGQVMDFYLEDTNPIFFPTCVRRARASRASLLMRRARAGTSTTR